MRAIIAIEDLINGNISDAKRKAKQCSFAKLEAAGLGIGLSQAQSQAAAYYLKTGEGWKRWCDSK